jgi:hypothetical protein
MKLRHRPCSKAGPRNTKEEELALRIATSFTLVLAIAATLAGVASGASLDRTGTWSPAASYSPAPPALALALVNDGSFEFGPPPASAWTEATVPACERIGDWSGQWYVSAFDGVNDYWAGGYCDDGTGINAPVTSSVTQSIPIVAGNAMLTFYYIAFRPDLDDSPPDGDRAYAAVNGIEVWSLPLVQANNTYPNWVGPISLDLGAYAGQTVALSFGGVGVGTATGNARIDFIEFTTSPTPERNDSWGTVKFLYR